MTLQLSNSGLPQLSSQDAGRLPDPLRQFAWTPAEKIIAHRNMHLLFPSEFIAMSDRPYPLHNGPSLDVVAFESAGRSLSLDDYIARSNLTGLIVVKGGDILLERYAHGNCAETIWASRSVAKSFTSTLIGMAIQDGFIGSVDDLLSDYLPELRGTLYENVTIRQNLWMTSGQPHASEFPSIIPFQECLARGDEIGCLMRELRTFASKTSDAHPPGARFAYHSVDVIVSGFVLDRATGLTPAKYLERKIWKPFGMERAACWNVEADGGATFANSGICATLRDWARFGMFMLAEGRVPDGERMLPPGWVELATTPSDASLLAGTPYGFNWWLFNEEDARILPGARSSYMARGNAGQKILINPEHDLVIAKWAAWDNPPVPPSGDDANKEDLLAFGALVRAAVRS